MPGLKIAIVGAGSAYMTSMFGSLARYAREGTLAGTHVACMDIVEGPLKFMAEWGNAGAKNDGIPLSFSWTTDLEQALDGADFVISCIRPGGGLDGRYFDETIPVKHRELGNETVGVGGVFMALRTIPDVVRIARAVADKCPNAWLVNYTNPTNMVVDASIRSGHRRSLGLCDGVWGVKWLAAKLLKISPARGHEIDAFVSGVNHHTWCMRLEHNGRDLYKIMDDLIAGADKRPLAGYETIDNSPFLNEVELDACRLYKYYGILPGTVYYSRYYYHLRKLMEEHYLKPGHEFRSEWLKKTRLDKVRAIEEQMKSGTASITPHDLEDAAHGDQAIGAINGIACGNGNLEAVIVPNTERTVPCLPADAIVEVTCRLGSAGPEPVSIPPLPLSVSGMVYDAYIFGKLSVDAAIARDRKLVLQAAMAHPAHRDLDYMEKIIDELFSSHKKYLGGFR